MIRRLLVPFAFVLCLFLVSEGTGQDKKKKGATITGAVTDVKADEKDKGAGTITVTTPEKKKKDVVVAEKKEHKFDVTKDTKIEKAAAKKEEKATPATFGDLEKGQNVAVTGEGGKAEKIVILPKKGK